MMKISDEELAAFVDGELDGDSKARVARAVAADPALAAKVEAHRALRDRLGAHFAPVLEQPVPDRLAHLLKAKDDNVVDFSAARKDLEARARPRTIPRWGWVAGPALAASLAIAILIPKGSDLPDGYAGSELASVLDNRLVAEQDSGADTRILLSFRREGGDYCRAFASTGQSGIACRDDMGWKLVEQMDGVAPAQSEFRQAGNAQAELLAAAQDMATGGALDSADEHAARDKGWED